MPMNPRIGIYLLLSLLLTTSLLLVSSSAVSDGPGGEGRFLLSVNSGYGIQFNAAGNRGQQSLSVIDLNAKPAAVVQNVYFPSPQSVNVGVVFAPQPQDDGSYTLYVSGGFENKIWIFRFQPDNPTPITPASPGPNTNVEA